MAFQIKNFVSIVASMINRMKVTQTKLTDFNIGSVGRTLVEAPAAEIDQLYQQMFNGLVEAIPVSVFQSFNFPPLAAMAATGTIQVTVTAASTAILITSGTQLTSTATANVYAATSNVLIPAGATSAAVPVVATTTGSGTNLVADVAFTLTPAPPGFVSASNPAPFVTGQNTETPAQQQVRFVSYIASLPRGIVAALYYGMSLASVQDANGNVIEKVVYSSVVEPWLTDSTQPVSLVNCYIHNGVGNTSPALLAQTQRVLVGYRAGGVRVPGYKAAGVKTVVYAAVEIAVKVAGTITPMPGYALADTQLNGVNVSGLVSQATAAIFAYLQTRPIGAAALVAEITALVMAVPGVYNYASASPAADVTANGTQKIMSGTIALT